MEKDLDVFISNNVDWSHHIVYAINKAAKQLERIKHAFEYIDEEIISLLYKSLVHPHLEFGAVIWSPHWQGDVDKLEVVQHRATKVSSLFGVSHEERNTKLRLPSNLSIHKIIANTIQSDTISSQIELQMTGMS